MSSSDAIKPAALRALGVGVVTGLVGGVVAGGIGLFASMLAMLPCGCLLGSPLQVLTPAVTGLLAGALAAFAAPWDDLRGIPGAGLGAGLGLVSSLVAASLTGLAGAVTVTALPVATNVGMTLALAGNSPDMVGAIMTAITGLITGLFVGLLSSTLSILAAGLGAVIGIVLGIGGGAGAGAMRSPS